MSIMDQDEDFRKMVKHLEEAADGRGCIMIPETINGKEW